MSLRLATFNVENLMNRFDFSGYRNQLNQDRTLALFDIQSEAEYKLLEQARAIAQSDDTRQLDGAGHRGHPRRHHLHAGGRQYRGAEGLRIRLSVQDGGAGLPTEIHHCRQ